jgi:hypothetical protein
MMPSYVGLTTLTGEIQPDELSAVAAALQIQVMRDFRPEWGATAMVSAVPFDAMPAGTIPLIVHEALGPRADGFHRTRRDETPYIVVPHGPTWSLAASHELLRMLANPSGSARIAGPSRMAGQGTVDYLLDVCAPCQDVTGCYAIDGVPVADFCTRAFFAGSTSARSFCGQTMKALDPLANGSVTWLADDRLLYQARADELGHARVHGGFSLASRGTMLVREFVDLLTPDRLPRLSNAPSTAGLLEARLNARRARMANATRFGEDIAWRFGYASVEAADAEPIEETASEATSASVLTHRRRSAAVEMMLRDAS